MIKKSSELNTETRSAMRDGPGTVGVTALATKEELLNHARMHSILTLNPGSGVGYHTHEGETEIFYIIDGEAEYNDNGTEVKLQAGDVAICAPGEGHSITNTTDKLTHVMATIVLA